MTTNKTTDECRKSSVNIHRCVSILPNDYANLVNLPTINGVNLLGTLKAAELNLLSSAKDDYENTTLENAKKEDGYVVVILPNGIPKTLSLDYIRSGGEVEGGFSTVVDFDHDAPIGSYRFVEKK